MALDRRRARWGGNAAIAIAALVGSCILVNVIAAKRFTRWDWTGSKLYSLSDTTLKTLQGLKQDVDVAVFLQPKEEMYDEVREILNNYRAKSSHLKVEFLDPARQPARVEQLLKTFGIDPREDSTAIVFSSGPRHKHITTNELVEYDMSEAMPGEPPKVKAFKGEIAFTSALRSVTEASQKAVYILKGHDEASPEQQDRGGLGRLVETLKRENLKVETTDVLGRSPLPADCSLLILAGPTRGFAPPEAGALANYLDGGGRVLAMIDPPFSRDRTLQNLGIESVFAERGIALGQDIVLDPSQKLLFGTAESFAASSFPPHEITKDLGGSYVVLGLARSASPIQPPPKGWSTSSLMMTSENGWAERDLAHLDRVTKGPEDLAGPISCAAAAEKDLGDGKKARFVLIGDSDLTRNAFLAAGANLDFALNCVHWLTGTEEQIGITAREPEQVHLSMTGTRERGIALFTILGMPALAIAAGVVVWLFRRR